MSEHTPENQESLAEASPNDSVNQSRRKLAGSALGVAAVFTLASRPVLATNCVSPSAAASGNLSQHGTPPTCSGRSPGYWKQHPTEWPSPYLPGSCNSGLTCNKPEKWQGGSLFHSTCMGSRFKADLDNNGYTAKTSLSMMQVMMLGDGSNPWGLTDPDNLGMHIVAALFNAKAGYTPVLTEMAVINMWNEWTTKGYFEPQANVRWSSANIVAYIQGTFS